MAWQRRHKFGLKWMFTAHAKNNKQSAMSSVGFFDYYVVQRARQLAHACLCTICVSVYVYIEQSKAVLKRYATTTIDKMPYTYQNICIA